MNKWLKWCEIQCFNYNVKTMLDFGYKIYCIFKQQDAKIANITFSISSNLSNYLPHISSLLQLWLDYIIHSSIINLQHGILSRKDSW